MESKNCCEVDINNVTLLSLFVGQGCNEIVVVLFLCRLKSCKCPKTYKICPKEYYPNFSSLIR